MIVPIDLPDELLQRVQGAAREQGIPFREFVANALQMAAATARPRLATFFSQRVHDFGAHLESPWTVLSEIETDDATRRNGNKK